MKCSRIIILCILWLPALVHAQQTNKLPFEGSALQNNKKLTILPYNRLIRSAGKVITYGDSLLENHALDVNVLPGKKNIVIEGRYGIIILNSKTNKIVAQWNFRQDANLLNLISTYSGITSFTYKNNVYIAWGASGYNHRSAIITAMWDGTAISKVSAINVQTVSPADAALPNQVLVNTENGKLFLYAVLNGNNQLIKIDFETSKIVYAAPVGVAPYGVCIIHNKAYVTNWAGPLVTDTLAEHAGTPWGSAYTNPATGATKEGSLSIINITNGLPVNELQLGLHPNAIIKSGDNKFLYITNGNSDYVNVVDVQKETVIDSIPTGLFEKQYHYYGSSPDALMIDDATETLYVANGMDNAIAVITLGENLYTQATGSTKINGYIPTEAYPSGIAMINRVLYVTNLEARGSAVLTAPAGFVKEFRKPQKDYTIHEELASISVIPLPAATTLRGYTAKVKMMNLYSRTVAMAIIPRKGVAPKPLPERIGEPSLFKHVVYIIKENKTYDEVFGDIAKGRGDTSLCIYGESVTPNQHKLAKDFVLLDNYYASGKSSAEGHQWTDAAMVSDYIEKNVRAWFRSYPHRQDDALVYNKNGFIWNNAMDHGKKVRIYGEACLTHYNTSLHWLDIYSAYKNHQPLQVYNTTTIGRIKGIISPTCPDCDNFNFTDQLRADVFINDWKKCEQQPGDSLPDLMILSLPNDHTAGISPGFPVPEAMVADNDLALARIIETITHSRFWDSTVVFVTEDDSQSGWDHLSPYRTTCLVISPYSKLAITLHTNYNQTSIVRSIEQILGLPPMNVIDATSLPMFDCFNNLKQLYPYKIMPNNIPLDKMNKSLAQLTGKAKYFARLSADEAFKELDSGDDDAMNRILWFAAKGNKRYPLKK